MKTIKKSKCSGRDDGGWIRNRIREGLLHFGMIFTILIVGMAVPLSVHGGTTTRVSVASDGTEGNGLSYYSAISANGRYVVFASNSDNLDPVDTDYQYDLYIHDRQTGQTNFVVNLHYNSFKPSISADGRYVAFVSPIRFTIDDTNGANDVFVHDRQTGQTTRVNVSSDGTQGDQSDTYYFFPSISADGRYVAFQSPATNLVSNDTNHSTDIFVHDRQTGQTTMVSVASNGTPLPYGGHQPSISADGRYVAFESLTPNRGTYGIWDVYVHDRQTGQTTMMSVGSDGTPGNDDSHYPSISADGRYVAFQSQATNLVSNDTNNQDDIFLHDRQTGQTTRVSVASDGTQANDQSHHDISISADGRYMAYSSDASNLVSDDRNVSRDVFVHDSQTGQTIRVSVASDGTQVEGGGNSPSISADGRFVSFDSGAHKLVSGDTNSCTDVFVHEISSAIIQATPSSLSFGYVPMGSMKDLILTVKNTGSDWSVTGNVTTEHPFSIVSGGNYSLGPGQSRSVTVRYEPKSKGPHTGVVALTGGSGATVQLTGTTKPLGLPWLMLLLGN